MQLYSQFYYSKIDVFVSDDCLLIGLRMLSSLLLLVREHSSRKSLSCAWYDVVFLIVFEANVWKHTEMPVMVEM